MRAAVCVPLLWLSTSALAQSADPAVPAPSVPASASVEISGSRDRARQLDTAAMTVVGRDELLRYGDQSVADALKRVPGITVSGVQGRGGEIRMRGLGNGYTRLLLNGQPTPAGFSIDSISPEQIERVEVMRVASAETGAQAIAGTINIVLRKSGAKPERDLKLAAGLTHDKLTPDVSGQFSTSGERWNASLGIVAVDLRGSIGADSEENGLDQAGLQNLRRLSRMREDQHRPTINLTPRLAWTLANGDTITSQNFERFLALDLRTWNHENTSLGASTSFPDNSVLFRAHTSTQRNSLEWLHQMEQGARLEVQIGRNFFRRRGTNDFEGTAPDPANSVSRIVNSTAREQSVYITGKYTVGQRGAHAIVAGWDGANGRRTETRLEDDSAINAQNPMETSSAKLARLAVYVQDDWTVTPLLSLSLGARYETIQVDAGGTLLDPVSRRMHAGGPLLQARYQVSKEGQFRLGLTRTFKLPTLENLAKRRYTVDNNNSPLTPDEQGNPALLPERAWGLDVAYEHYFSKRSMVSASVYARRIDDVTLAIETLQGASWVSMPRNAGRAEAHGIELEGKTTYAGFDLRANGARNWSRVDSLLGSDSRLPSQTPFSGGVGIDHKLDSLPLTLSANLTVQGGGHARLERAITVDSSSQRELNMVAVWRLDAHSSWRLSMTNLLAQQHNDRASYSNGLGGLSTLTATPTWSTFRLAFESKL